MNFMSDQFWDSRMDAIDTEAIRAELAGALSHKFDLNRAVAVFGAGDSAERCFANPVHKEGNIRYFIDDTPEKRGAAFMGWPVITTEQARELCRDFLILICSDSPKNSRTMYQVLCEHPIDGADVCLYASYHFCRHAGEVLTVYDMLEDPLSKATYADMILYRMGERPRDQAYTCSLASQYFAIPQFSDIRFDEVFVDCGAYVGDTFERFLANRSGNFQSYYAFEPDARNFEAFRTRMERLEREWSIPEGKIHLVPCGVGDKSCHLSADSQRLDDKKPDWSAFELLSHTETVSGGVPVCTVDEYFAQQPITFLKADIEGFEERMLRGARAVIRRDRPKLAVCLYHNPSDMYRLPLLIKEYCPEYKFLIRQHYFSWWETVLYGYV